MIKPQYIVFWLLKYQEKKIIWSSPKTFTHFSHKITLILHKNI